MRKLVALGCLLCSAIAFHAQAFSGSIEFRYSTQKDTTTNIYCVKDNKVKLDQLSKGGTGIEGSFLFDVYTNEIKFLNPKRKLWGKMKSEIPAVIRGTCVTTKGSGSKKIAGIICKEYNVKNVEENTSVTYWIAEGSKFNFFMLMIKLWNRKDKQSIYFTQIKGLPEGSMPLFSEEKSLTDGKILTKLEVTKINHSPPDNATFEIPIGYSKFE